MRLCKSSRPMMADAGKFGKVAWPLVAILILYCAGSAFGQGSSQPVIQFISPSSGRQGTRDLTVSMVGSFTSFDEQLPSSTVPIFRCRGVNVDLTNLQINSATSLTVDIDIEPDAEIGPCDVIVVTGGPDRAEVALGRGIFNVIALAPAAPLPSIATVFPANAVQGSSDVTVEIGISDLDLSRFDVAAADIAFSGGPPERNIDVASADITSGTNITLVLNVVAGAVVGPRDLTIQLMNRADGSRTTIFGANSFTVSSLAGRSDVTLNPAEPPFGFQGTTLDVTIVGTDTTFTQGLTAVIFGGTTSPDGQRIAGGITINELRVVNQNILVVNITIASNAPPGLREIRVFTSGDKVIPLGEGRTQVIPIDERTRPVNFEVLSTAAPAAVGAAPRPEPLPPSITIAANQSSFTTLDNINIAVGFRNTDIAQLVDAFIALQAPNGQLFVLEPDLRTFSPIEEGLKPVARNLILSPGTSVENATIIENNVSRFIEALGVDPPFGIYTLFAAFSRAQTTDFFSGIVSDSFIFLRQPDIQRFALTIDVTPDEIPFQGSAFVTVSVADARTGQPVDGVTVALIFSPGMEGDPPQVETRNGVATFFVTDRSEQPVPGPRLITATVGSVSVSTRILVGF